MVFSQHNISLQLNTNLLNFRNSADLLCHKPVEQSKFKLFSFKQITIDYLTSTPNMYLSNIEPPNVCPPTSFTANVTLYEP